MLGLCCFFLTDTIKQLEPHAYHYTNCFESAVGYTPLDLSCTRLMALISFANAVLPYMIC